MLICLCIVMPCVSVRIASTSFIRAILLLCCLKVSNNKICCFKNKKMFIPVHGESFWIHRTKPESTGAKQQHIWWGLLEPFLSGGIFKPKPTFWTPKISWFCIYLQFTFPKNGPLFGFQTFVFWDVLPDVPEIYIVNGWESMSYKLSTCKRDIF